MVFRPRIGSLLSHPPTTVASFALNCCVMRRSKPQRSRKSFPTAQLSAHHSAGRSAFNTDDRQVRPRERQIAEMMADVHRIWQAPLDHEQRSECTQSTITAIAPVAARKLSTSHATVLCCRSRTSQVPTELPTATSAPRAGSVLIPEEWRETGARVIQDDRSVLF